MKAERLRKIPLFQGLSDHEYERLERWTDEIDVPTNKHLVNQGAYPHEFMVIETGTAEVTHDGVHLADLGPGDFFGEIALLDGGPRTATVTTLTDVQLLGLTEWVFRGLMKEHPAIAVKTLQQMAGRLRTATKAATA